MANSKISALTSATTPLAGTETLPIVQGGATVKTTVADITNGGGYAGSFTTLSATGVTTVQAGTALLPAITTSGDTNTGIWFPAADTIAFTEGGVESFRIDSSGNVGIGRTSPVGRLDVFAASGGGAGTVVPVSITVGDTSTGNSWPGDGTLSTVFNYFSGDGTNNGVRFRHGVGETNTSGSTSVWKIQYRAAGGAINSYTGFSDALAVDSSGNVGIGTAAPGAKLELNESTNASLPILVVARGGNSLTAQHRYLTKTSGGANTGGAVGFNATYGLVLTASSTSIDGARDLIVDSAGSALVIGGGGLGYGTGSGGTVTQVTSRTTGVTLNKTNGAITLVSAAGLATFQSFTVTNSKVAATDVVHVTQKSGTDLYQIFVTATAAGSFRITFATTGGITVEQPVFNFAIIKAVTA